MRTFIREFWIFGLKQAAASIFGGYLLLMILLTRMYYPDDAILFRNDFLFLAAVLFQVVLLWLRLESPAEAFVVIIFHIVATVMEVFKTSDAIRAWQYPGEFTLGFGNVPLFAGFMYSAVGSYMARVWRIFDFRFTRYPPTWSSWVLVILVYVNFFTHHFTVDLRWFLLVLTIVLFGRCTIYFRMDQIHRRMPLIIGWLLVAFFIWIAENISTFAGIWLYPVQEAGWQMVPVTKLIAWFLLMQLSFVLVSVVHVPKPMTQQ